MNTCIGALCFLLLSSTHSTKLFPRVVRASTTPSTAISARARPRSLTRGWGRVWGVVVEPLSGKIPKKDPPLWELFGEFSSETNSDEDEKLLLPVATREERAIPSQSVSTLMLSIPARRTTCSCGTDNTSACCLQRQRKSCSSQESSTGAKLVQGHETVFAQSQTRSDLINKQLSCFWINQ